MTPEPPLPKTDFLDLRRSASEELAALVAVFQLTLRQNTRGRRLWVLLVLYLLPCVLAVVLRSIPHPAPPDILEFALVFLLLPQGLAPLTALLYAGGMIQDEVEEQTLTYLLLRPLPRWALYLGKFLGTLLTTTLLVTLGMAALYVAIYWNTSELWDGSVGLRPLQALGIAALAQVGYVALFGLLGVLTRRTLIAGVAYIVAFEGILANLRFMARALTVIYYTRVLSLRWLTIPPHDQREWLNAWGIDLDLVPDAQTCVLTLLGLGLVGTMLAIFHFVQREYRMKTPEGS